MLILMKQVIWFFGMLAVIGLLLLVGCGADGSATIPDQQAVAVESVESAYIVGKWAVNDGRFGHKIFDFQADGRLRIEDVETGEIIEMDYLFVEDSTLTLTGYEDFNGSATASFYEDKMDLTINFDGTIFAELYVFMRLDEASN